MFDALTERVRQADISTWPYVLGVIFLSYLVASTVASYWTLRHFPGPWLAGFSNLWYIKAATSGESHLYLANVCNKYGMRCPSESLSAYSFLTASQGP